VNKTEFQFISVARFVPQKNLFLLVRAFRKVYEVCPHARLVLIGQGPQHKLIQDQITKEFGLQSPDQGPVIMMSWTDDVPAFLRGADAYVLSSNYEGWGRVLIEAMCAQLPIVTTDVGCVGEVMQAGVHGIVVPVGDCDELTKAMIVMIKDTAAYQMYKKNLQGLPVHDLPGTHFKSYGQDWVRTLGVN